MPEIKAKLNYLRQAPRKVRLVADLIRGMKVKEAKVQLEFSPKRASKALLKLLNSAIANAKHNFGLSDEEIEKLVIKEIQVDEGPKLKRWMPQARGSAHPIHKKTSHITIILEKKE